MLDERGRKEVMAGLATIPEESNAWRGLMRWIDDCISDANEVATNPGTLGEQRAWWAGAERFGRDLKGDLIALRNGTFGKEPGQQIEEEED